MKLNISLLSLVVAEAVAINCFDGENGQCSHYCNAETDACECPTCWTLQDDMETCKPSSDKVSITCGHTGITVNIDECVYGDGTDTLSVGFNSNAGCASAANNGTLTVSTGLDGCGVTYEAVDDAIVFTNTITILDRVSPAGIVFSSDVNFDVECSFNTTVTGLNADTVVTSPELTGGTSGTGAFAFVASYYTDAAFENVSDVNDTIVVGESLRFGIHPSISVENVRFYVNECVVTDAGVNSFAVLDNMCPAFVVSDYSGFVNNDMFTMTYKSFQFEGKLD